MEILISALIITNVILPIYFYIKEFDNEKTNEVNLFLLSFVFGFTPIYVLIYKVMKNR
jgi:hypothetical protein